MRIDIRSTRKKINPKRVINRQPRNTARFQLSKDVSIEYKNISVLQKFLNDRGKIIPRRYSGLSARQQRKLVTAIKRARYLALLITGGYK